jgi:hypothetical protein
MIMYTKQKEWSLIWKESVDEQDLESISKTDFVFLKMLTRKSAPKCRFNELYHTYKNSLTLVREQNIRTERSLLVGEVSANLCR